MPSIKGIDFSDGIRIIGSGIPSAWIKEADFPKISPGEAEKEREMEGILTSDLQANYEVKTLLSDVPDINADDPLMQDPPILEQNERIEKIRGKDTLITTLMYAAVHIFSTSPLKYTVRCSDSPIGGEWWL